MSDLPTTVRITEEGPREGFQIEKGAIPTARKIALIDALSQTGLDHIQIVSFVNPKNVPGMADADDVVRGITPQPGVAYTALWLNEKGFRARAQLTTGSPIPAPSSCAPRKNSSSAIRTAPPRSSSPGNMRSSRCTKRPALPVERGSIMAAFGCNFEGDIPVARVVALVAQILDVATEHGVTLRSHARRHHGLGDAACDQARRRRACASAGPISTSRCICTIPAAWRSPMLLPAWKWA